MENVFQLQWTEKNESIGTADIGNGYFHLKFDIANALECDNTQFEDENKIISTKIPPFVTNKIVNNSTN